MHMKYETKPDNAHNQDDKIKQKSNMNDETWLETGRNKEMQETAQSV